MEHFLELDSRFENFLNTELFPSIYKGEVILFLGAGASVTEKKFLGIDTVEYYQDKLGFDAETKDLIEFMDMVGAMPNFSREDFDNYLVNVLSKLTPTETHKTIASLNWNQIITTNVDLIVERAFDLIENTVDHLKSLKLIRNTSDFHQVNGNGIIKYIKLNGCIKDKSKYPLIFSSKDFEQTRSYHKLILRSLSNLTYDVKFLSVGYSFFDPFSKHLIKHFDSFNFRNKKPIYCVDPYIQDGRLPLLKDNGIVVLKITSQDIFKLYKGWEEKHSEELAKRKNITFKSIENNKLQIGGKLKLQLGNNVNQLTDDIPIKSYDAEAFYKGEVPTYDVIRRNYDVVKVNKMQSVKTELYNVILKNGNKIIPIFFLTGMFGTGKSTFLYRLLHGILHDANFKAVAFELHELNNIRVQDLEELFSLTKAKNIFITCHEIELDSSFKEMMNLRNQLSVAQFTNFNVYFLVSIRENIYQKFLRSYKYTNTYDINIDDDLTKEEATDLISKLNENNLIAFRDVHEKNVLVNKVLSDYGGDTFISLISLVSKSNFTDILYGAYEQLTKEAKEAFLYTSLIYQYKILMPSALLMKIVSKDWKSFEDDILRYDSKNILIQEIREVDLRKDLYFRTKHPLLSKYLIDRVLKKDDEKFDRTRRLVSQLVENDENAKLFIDLIKSIRYNKAFDEEKIDKLYDIADQIFDTNPHFVIHYSINLQQRKTIVHLKKALAKISHSEAFLERRNHLLTHRRAVLNYNLAKLTYNIEKKLNKTYSFIEEARELFEIKRMEDPFSSYSYIDYINLELWVLNKVQLEEKELLLLHIRIQELFDIASRAVFENSDLLIKLRAKYYIHLESNMKTEDKTLMEYLDELYEVEETRPYSLVLKYNYLWEKGDRSSAEGIIPELEYYKFNDEVSKTLFTYYGRNLHQPNLRSNFFSLIKGGYDFKNKDLLRYNFYSYIAESYNKNFRFSFENLDEIYQMGTILNPNLHDLWLNEDGEEEVFTGIITSNKRGYIQVKVLELQQSFRVLKDSIKHFQPKLTEKYTARLHFYIQGIRVELIEKL